MTGFLDRKRDFRGLLANLRFPVNVQSNNHRSRLFSVGRTEVASPCRSGANRLLDKYTARLQYL